MVNTGFEEIQIRLRIDMANSISTYSRLKIRVYYPTLELRFKRQILMIFIVNYIYKKGFLKNKFFSSWTIL